MKQIFSLPANLFTTTNYEEFCLLRWYERKTKSWTTSKSDWSLNVKVLKFCEVPINVNRYYNWFDSNFRVITTLIMFFHVGQTSSRQDLFLVSITEQTGLQMFVHYIQYNLVQREHLPLSVLLKNLSITRCVCGKYISRSSQYLFNQ